MVDLPVIANSFPVGLSTGLSPGRNPGSGTLPGASGPLGPRPFPKLISEPKSGPRLTLFVSASGVCVVGAVGAGLVSRLVSNEGVF